MAEVRDVVRGPRIGPDTTTPGWKLPSIAIAGHILAIIAALRSWRRWNQGRFVLIASLAGLGLVAFTAIRVVAAAA